MTETSSYGQALHYYARFDEKLRERLRALITDELIAEHKENPLGFRGHHSPDLQFVLNYFRRSPQAGKYIIVASVPWQEYRIGVLSASVGWRRRCSKSWCSQPKKRRYTARSCPRPRPDGRRALTAGREGGGVHTCAKRTSTATATCRAWPPESGSGFYVSCEEEGSYRADVVRLVYGDTNPAGPGSRRK
jgi:hypothetical protein